MLQALGPYWFELLRDEISKNYFIVLGRVISELKKTNIIYPETFMDIFSVFRSVAPKDVKVVILGQDPYPDGSYDGMAFSNSNDTLKLSPSLANIFKEIEDDVYEGLKLDHEPNLKRWADQGVLLLNRVLTVEKNRPGAHRGIGWERFTNKVIEVLAELESPKVFMLWGNDAKSVKKLIKGDQNLILESGHPSPLSANRGYWFGNKHFSKANEFLEQNGLQKIIW
jgi:uracil-DNA glycosylase